LALASIDLDSLEFTHEFKKHPDDKSGAWKCGGIDGVDRCLSGINDFYQTEFDEVPLKGLWDEKNGRDVCTRCFKAYIFIQN